MCFVALWSEQVLLWFQNNKFRDLPMVNSASIDEPRSYTQQPLLRTSYNALLWH